MLNEHRLVRALLRKPVDRTPIWIMRQAGRYLPEYRVIRSKVKDFLKLCKTPELACQITLQPLERFPLDAAIIFSDILTIPDAFGLELAFLEGEGPYFQRPICTLEDVEKLPTIDPEIELRYVMDAIRMTKRALKDRVPLIGFAGSPWTIATYMVEGKISKNFTKIKKLMVSEPMILHRLLTHLSTTIVSYLKAQVMAGAEVLMIFDTWGGVLSCADYLDFSLSYMQEIVANLNFELERENAAFAVPSSGGGQVIKKVPIILFTKNVGQNLEALSETGCDAVGIDWTLPLDKARSLVGHKVALQGNLDPAVLYADPDFIQRSVQLVLRQFGKGSGHVFNLGHGIYPDVEPEKVAIMIEAVQSFSTRYTYE